MNIQRIALLTSFFIAPFCFAAQPPPKTLTPGDNLVIDGIPPIPMAQNFCLESRKFVFGGDRTGRRIRFLSKATA
jgi:hypothetical protein